jgi:hypothetical protein
MDQPEPWLYPLQVGDTLATNDWIEWHMHRFLGSGFVAQMKYLDRRDVIGVAIELWSKSYLSDPAGTLPDNDVYLADKAGFGIDVGRWQAIRPLAMWGWSPVLVEGRDGMVANLLGHRLIAEIAVLSWRRKDGRAQAREAARLSSVKHKVKQRLLDFGHKTFAANENLLEEIARHFQAASLHVTAENVSAALTTLHGIPRVVSLKGGDRAR